MEKGLYLGFYRNFIYEKKQNRDSYLSENSNEGYRSIYASFFWRWEKRSNWLLIKILKLWRAVSKRLPQNFSRCLFFLPSRPVHCSSSSSTNTAAGGLPPFPLPPVHRPSSSSINNTARGLPPFPLPLVCRPSSRSTNTARDMPPPSPCPSSWWQRLLVVALPLLLIPLKLWYGWGRT